jgi:hypothetical protein
VVCFCAGLAVGMIVGVNEVFDLLAGIWAHPATPTGLCGAPRSRAPAPPAVESILAVTKRPSRPRWH